MWVKLLSCPRGQNPRHMIGFFQTVWDIQLFETECDLAIAREVLPWEKDGYEGLRVDPPAPKVLVTSEKELSSNIIYIVLQTSIRLL